MVEGASASPPPRVGSPAKGSGAAAGFTFGVRSPTTGRESVKDDVYLHSSKRQEAGAPGPGHYYVAPSWNGAKVSIKGRLQHKDEADRSPGFAYHPDDRATSPRKRDPAFSFGSSTRPPLAGKLGAVPGPGAYGAPDVRKTGRARTAPAYSIQSRVWMPDKREDSPGPIYTPAGPRPGGVSFGLKPDVMIGSSVKNDVFLAGTSPARAGKALGPGPGQYPVYVPKAGPAFSIQGRWKKDPYGSDAPGPGAYVMQPPRSAGSNAPGTGFVKAPRDDPAPRGASDMPGPGQYYVAPSWNGAKVSIKGRLQHKDEADRSPGFAYHPDDRATSPRKRDPAFSFGSSTRPPLAGKLGAVPGPGAYGAPDVRKTARHPSAPAFSIQARVWMPDKREDSPGPIYTPAGPRPGGVSFGLKPDVMIGSSVKNDVFLAGTSPARAGKALGPGPGQYPVYVPKPGPAFSIQGRWHERS